MNGLRNSEATNGVEIIGTTSTQTAQQQYDALTPPKQGVLYILGDIAPGGYVESTYTMEEYTPAVYTPSEFNASAATLQDAIDSYVASTNVAATYTASQYTASTHDFERIAVTRVYNGAREQMILTDNSGQVVWMHSDLIDANDPLFVNTPIIVEDLI